MFARQACGKLAASSFQGDFGAFVNLLQAFTIVMTNLWQACTLVMTNLWKLVSETCSKFDLQGRWRYLSHRTCSKYVASEGGANCHSELATSSIQV
ncbi:hypothetical protein AVEN_29045-1 [Araneus ventricosus]|uniref:Uncharacterized protein n=1 Tax=Araneus ventricosus TaxID=182803 RepID=A0A4Y2ALB7_ARAVE|nr:hypothetical protein AVEN_29045-1 [Araneus ventricosus]